MAYLNAFLEKPHYREVARSLDCQGKLDQATNTLEKVKSPQRLEELRGTIGRDSFGT